MLMKLLITAAVAYVAYLVLRARRQDADGSAPDSRSASESGSASGGAPEPLRRTPLIPSTAVKLSAYALVALMLTGSTFYLFQRWDQSRQVVEVQVVNPYNGQIQTYQARRGDIDGRAFRALDGRKIRIAETERIIIGDGR
jgi:hypothetical protein